MFSFYSILQYNCWYCCNQKIRCFLLPSGWSFNCTKRDKGKPLRPRHWSQGKPQQFDAKTNVIVNGWQCLFPTSSISSLLNLSIWMVFTGRTSLHHTYVTVYRRGDTSAPNWSGAVPVQPLPRVSPTWGTRLSLISTDRPHSPHVIAWFPHS